MRLDPFASPSDRPAEGRATYGMANLRPERTGLPFIVFISQRDDARHAARVKVSPAPKVKREQMASYSVTPVSFTAGDRLSGLEEWQLESWIALNRSVIERYWDGEIEFAEDALALLRPI